MLKVVPAGIRTLCGFELKPSPPSVCTADLYFLFPVIPAIIGDYLTRVSLLSILFVACSEVRSPRPIALCNVAP